MCEAQTATQVLGALAVGIVATFLLWLTWIGFRAFGAAYAAEIARDEATAAKDRELVDELGRMEAARARFSDAETVHWPERPGRWVHDDAP